MIGAPSYMTSLDAAGLGERQLLVGEAEVLNFAGHPADEEIEIDLLLGRQLAAVDRLRGLELLAHEGMAMLDARRREIGQAGKPM